MPLPLSPQPGNESDASSSFNTERTPYESLGGDQRVRALVDAFYDHMDQDQDAAGIRALHQPDLTSAREKLYEFLSGWLGGPQLYLQKHGHPRLRKRHAPFPIGPTERAQWLACMARALDDLGIDGELRTFLAQRFEHVARFMENRPGSDG